MDLNSDEKQQTVDETKQIKSEADTSHDTQQLKESDIQSESSKKTENDDTQETKDDKTQDQNQNTQVKTGQNTEEADSQITKDEKVQEEQDQPKKDDKPVEDNSEQSKDEVDERAKVPKCAGMSEEEVLEFITNRVKILKELEEYDNNITLSNLKGISNTYFKHKSKRMTLALRLVEEDYPALVIKMLIYFNNAGIFKSDDVWFPAYYTMNTAWNFSDASKPLARALAEAGLIKLLVDNLKHEPYLNNLKSKNVTYVIKSSLSILQNISQVPEVKHIFIENNVMQAAKPFTLSENNFLNAVSLMLISSIASEEENKELQDTGAIEFMVNGIKKALSDAKGRYRGFSPIELAEALGRLAANDENKLKIVNDGALPLFLTMLQSDKCDQQLAAAKCLWNLSFNEEARKAIKEEPGCVDALQNLINSPEKAISRAANGALWIINDTASEKKHNSKEATLKNHIFISYNWGSQPTILKLAERFKRDGFRIWIDVDQMGGSTLEAMADGVENAAVVLICMSEKYKLSPNCRTEGEYTFQLGKPIVPVMMQRGYKPDGWLGMMLGAKLYINLDGKHTFDVAYNKLLKELNGRGRDAPGEQPDVATSVIPVSSAPVAMPTSQQINTVKKWDCKKVQDWLTDAGINVQNGEFADMDGSLLVTLHSIKAEAPEFFYQSLDTKMKLSMVNILKFVKALGQILP